MSEKTLSQLKEDQEKIIKMVRELSEITNRMDDLLINIDRAIDEEERRLGYLS